MKLLYGGFGHHPSGKSYNYWGGDNLRVGQNVNVPVTNKKTGKTYNTMFTITATSGSMTDRAMNVEEQLYDRGINIKEVNGLDVSTLPGFAEWGSKSQWKQWSDLLYEENVSKRLMGDFGRPNTSIARSQLLGG